MENEIVLFDLKSDDIFDKKKYTGVPSKSYLNDIAGAERIVEHDLPKIKFNLSCHFIHIPIKKRANKMVYLIMRPFDIVRHDLNKLCKEIPCDAGFSWKKYKNDNGEIDNQGKIDFLLDYIKKYYE